MHRLKRWFTSLWASYQLATNPPPAAPPQQPPAAGADPHAPIPQPEGLSRDQVAQCALLWMTVVPPEAAHAGAFLLRRYYPRIYDDVLQAQAMQETFGRFMQALARHNEAQAAAEDGKADADEKTDHHQEPAHA